MNDLLRKEDVLQAIHNIGGCDAADEWSRGYDAGVNAAYATISNLKLGEDPRIEYVVRHYGSDQKKIMLEEMFELGLAIMKLDRGWSKERFNNLKEEVADVFFMVRQLRLLYGSDEIDRIIDEKIERQLSRIRAEKEV